MKETLQAAKYALFILLYLGLAGTVLMGLKPVFFPSPAEQAALAAEAAAQDKAHAAEIAAAAAKATAARADLARIEALKPEFITWLQRNAGAQTGRFDGDVLEVKFDHGWPSPDAARVKAEALARAWRLRSRLDYAKCNIYWGNEIVGSGISR